MRSDEKPFPIESSSPREFRTWANRSYQRVKGCYCVSARARGSGVFAKSGIGQEKKDAERRDKESPWTGEQTRLGQSP